MTAVPHTESTPPRLGVAVIGAGARDPSGGWLVGIYADTVILPMGTFEPVLRALVAVAVAGAADATQA